MSDSTTPLPPPVSPKVLSTPSEIPIYVQTASSVWPENAPRTHTTRQHETDGRRNLFDCFSVTRCHIFHTTIRVSPNFFDLTSTARRKAETEAKRAKKKDTYMQLQPRATLRSVLVRHSWDPISNSRSNANIARHFFEADHCPQKKSPNSAERIRSATRGRSRLVYFSQNWKTFINGTTLLSPFQSSLCSASSWALLREEAPLGTE